MIAGWADGVRKWRRMRVILFPVLAAVLIGQPRETIAVGPGVRPPKVLRHVAAEYPPGASARGLEGTVVYEITFDSRGGITEFRLLRSAGNGFDEAAKAAIKNYKFQPAMKDNQPVAYRSTIEINFRLPDSAAARKRTRQRDEFNNAILGMRSPDPAGAQGAVKALVALSKDGFAPAQFAEGMARLHGQGLPIDKEAGLALIQAAAKQEFPAAVGQTGIYYFEGRHLPLDKAKGMHLLQSAAAQNSFVAALYLGELNRVDHPEEAAQYYRRCAGQRQSTCQTRLGEYLLNGPREFWPEAVAWLQLAVAQNHSPARELLDVNLPKLSEEERQRADALRPQLAGK
jgi:TonB family protein